MAHAPPPMAASKELPPAQPLQQPAPPQTPAAATHTPLPSPPLAPPQAVPEVAPPQAVPEVAPPQAVPEVAPPQAVPEVAPPQAVPEAAAPPFVFILPPDTSGTALTKRWSDEPLGPDGLPQSKTTAWYCRKKAEEEQRLGVKRRQYTRCAVIKCRQCGQPRKDGKHHQLYSNWYCPNTATVSSEDWEVH